MRKPDTKKMQAECDASPMSQANAAAYHGGEPE